MKWYRLTKYTQIFIIMAQYRDTLRAHSPGYYDKPGLEETGHILLPESVLDAVMRGDRIPEVMLFEIRNKRLGLSIYAGVQSFTTEPGHICMPWWMMEHLQIEEHDVVDIKLTTLPTATRALFQPQDSEFLDLPNPKVVLEYTLRQHRCLTQGTMLSISFNNHTYKLKVLKTEPAKAVSTLRADVICDFATPVSEFTHNWCDPDTDSSDEEELHKPKVFRTLNGKVFTEKPKPIRSTYAQREQDRRTKPDLVGVTKIEDGKEILPPKPRESNHKKKEAPSAFVGAAHTIKKKKGEPAPVSAPSPAPAPAPEKKSSFVGQARTLKSNSQAPAPTEKPANEPAPKPSPFQGKPRSLK